MCSITVIGKAHAIYMDASSNSLKRSIMNSIKQNIKALFTWMRRKRKKLARVP